MASAKYQGYKGYGNSKNRKNIRQQEDFVIDQLPEVKSDLIPEATMNVGAVFNLAKFLENSNSKFCFCLFCSYLIASTSSACRGIFLPNRRAPSSVMR